MEKIKGRTAVVTDAGGGIGRAIALELSAVGAQRRHRGHRQGGDSYVASASLNGIHSSPYNLAYGAAKAGLVSLVRSLAAELAPTNVRVNAIPPGIIATPRMQHLLDTTGRNGEFADAVPMKRLGSPEDVAGAALFLTSPLASYITGQVIGVDGGASVKYPLALMTDTH
ncbi:SDR family oxidoreductase [Rhodococcus sp. DMU1]|uniref:SDR family NAD(P)-dependent oxidoreductase n=1 Tax=Rhodococcus sp. DMU1 TaxID=2722825 RepID=UPI00143EBD99|nr:SDR family oxidoreductase [Rhodococcus sp. DMU1]QIX53638.1 SDR family oxidoreductase [Rhodococcus sp. DMU1]